MVWPSANGNVFSSSEDTRGNVVRQALRLASSAAAGLAIACMSGTVSIPAWADTTSPTPSASPSSSVSASPSSSATSASPSTSVKPSPTGPDPAKPVPLPSPRIIVNATFTPTGNSLGLSPRSTSNLGVGVLPQLTFSHSISNKAVVERHLTVTARSMLDQTVTPVLGSWAWLDDRTIMFRPLKYWPGHAQIAIASTLGGAVMGKSGSHYLVGAPSLEQAYSFTTGRSFIAFVNGKSDRMNVYIDGQKVKTIPVSLGQKGWETRNGVKVIGTGKEPTHTYTSAALNLTSATDTKNPAYYQLVAPWNTRLTPSGEFIHAAPWAYFRIGKWNGSHGCTNMRIEDAKWIYDTTIPGDVVVYSNTGGATEAPGNGPGGLWNIPWHAWLAKSALSNSSGTVDLSPLPAPSSSVPAASA